MRLFKSDVAQFAWDKGLSHQAFIFEIMYSIQLVFRKVLNIFRPIKQGE